MFYSDKEFPLLDLRRTDLGKVVLLCHGKAVLSMPWKGCEFVVLGKLYFRCIRKTVRLSHCFFFYAMERQ